MKLTATEIEIAGILEKDARLTNDELAKMTDLSVDQISQIVKKLEDQKVIVRYVSLVDWTKIDGHQGVTAMIDVKVTPKRDVGFNEVAKRIYRHKEVKSVYLMSGTYDLSVQVEGQSVNDVAHFVSQKLSTIEGVISTTTHFVLKKFKHDGTIYDSDDRDKRIVVSP
ncbi:Lrp/AsnC family transcriptional regulator [Sporolactobacillus terrae]|uniref:Lrp/AsnC family transcriptional regulator n=1 Tax=Sporolactobacillus terrae TaxID=269673 RepID=A0A410DD13_9BACL|nr:Lrp/AsnC family transcriptional regulator [Sporolactobacillus terrae]QAA22578.1 Lrp/AsnC family transcriptional regulator [Sporolactobacillus terrae]QAA26993.1 Lrp/AsnC family transcriptional regulator [Sporolactobacillus terrae]UAK17913.1 Lrp/AsnC family transcriptional regulator [Sporolactobacillus terrae]BBN98898.1 putative HTH-type transcriptional regulator YugG [Sporolactobacillus terrae]